MVGTERRGQLNGRRRRDAPLCPGEHRRLGRLTGRFDRLTLGGYEEIIEVYEQYGDYLYLETDDGRKQYFVVNQAIERHLMRTLISERIGHPERASWREHGDLGLLVDGMAALRPLSASGRC